MFNKSHKKHVLIETNNFYNYLDYISICIKTKYPVLDKDLDIQKRDDLLENVTTLMKNFEIIILDYKDNKYSLSELEWELEKYKRSYSLLELNFPILEAFKRTPSLYHTSNSVFPGTDIFHYGFSQLLNTNK